MDPENWRKIHELFEAALERPISQRAAFLASACAGDEETRRRVEAMLAADAQTDLMIDRPAHQAAGAFAHSMPAPDDEQNLSGEMIGVYRLVKELGRGGMGTVYLAYDTKLGRQAALKLLPSHLINDPERVRRFQREARSASALNHPNIITIFDFGHENGRDYIVSEFVEGRTLRDYIVKLDLSLNQILDLAVQVTSALEAAHAAGIVHRDIKPENIMLRPDGYVKVLDFGMAKQIEPEGSESGANPLKFNTDPGIVMGTVNYMSPEQARGVSVDTRSDTFSLGVVLYELLSGQAPFSGPTLGDVIVSILDREPQRLSKSLKEIPAELERIIGKSLRKDREERYQSVKDLHLDLKRLQQEIGLQAKLEDSSKRVALDIPEIKYARSGDVNIAYQIVGEGPFDLVFVMGWVSHLEYFWSEPSFARFLRRLATFSRVILFDKRGTGLSDHVPLDQLPTLEQRMDDVRAVMEAVGCERAVLCGISEGGPMCSLFSATYPEKTMALVMIGSYARRLKGEGYPWGPTEIDRELFFDEIRKHWGGPVGLDERAPSVANDPAFRDWWAAYLRRGASPSAALALTEMNTEIDIRHVLQSIRVPTLVIHRTGDPCLKVEEGRYLAENIPGAAFVELPGIDHLPFVGDQDAIIDAIEEFLTGMRQAEHVDRVLATVLVAKVTGWPADAQGRDLLDRHQSLVKKEVELFKGRAVEVTAESLLATFDGPARAIRAACAISDSARRRGIRFQTGLHTGECDVMNDRVAGTAVEIASQLAVQSSAGEVLVSSTVKDLVAGSGIRFAERGARSLDGDLGEWKLFAIERGAV